LNTPRVNWNPPFTKFLVSQGIFKSEPFCLVDVGASGGIDGYWEVFGASLRAIGFDGLFKEVERLNAAAGPNRQYYACLVGDKSYQPAVGLPDAQPFPRTSAGRWQERSQKSYAATFYDQTGEGKSAMELIELDQFLLRDHPMDVDFIKIDTDGSDYQVLRGAKELLAGGKVLGLGVESQFHGVVHDESNVFRNIDRVLTAAGFSLFDIEVYRYSRAALPKRFVYRIPAQTETGQVLWGDALYLRDAGSDTYETDWGVTLSPHKILKLACLCELFGVEDCTAELLLKYEPVLREVIDMQASLDKLTPALTNEKLSYRNYIQRLESKPELLYPPK
jgi:FkbM family methyltransferase